jgi:hypothetical protein
MTDKVPDPAAQAALSGRQTNVPGKDDRRAAALKANLARRKAQTRARAGDAGVRTDEEQEQP